MWSMSNKTTHFHHSRGGSEHYSVRAIYHIPCMKGGPSYPLYHFWSKDCVNMTKLQFCRNVNNIITPEEYIAKDLGDCDSIHGN